MNILKRIFRRAKGVFINLGRSESGGDYRTTEELINEIADRIATQVAKLTPQVIRKDDKGVVIKNDRFAKMLALRPCRELNTADWLYKMAHTAVRTGDAFAIIVYNKDFTEIEEIPVVSCSNYKIFEIDGLLFFRFTWTFDSKEYTVPYDVVIHLKDRPTHKRFLGTNPAEDLSTSIDMLNTTYTGIKNVINNSAQLRGYLKFNNWIDDDELKAKITEFQKAYMSAANEGGLAGIGSEWDFKELSQTPKQIPTSQLEFFKENIRDYFGMSKDIIKGDYNEDKWNAFYESKIEIIAMRLSMEFTYKVYSERQRGFGNSIKFVADRLQYATATARMTIATALFDRGGITLNRMLEIMDEPTLGEEGDVRMVSLNYVKVSDQSLYQTGKEDSNASNKE